MNINNPPPTGYGIPLFQWIVENVLSLKRRINGITSGGSGAGMAIGNPITGANADRVLFSDTSSNLGQSDGLTFDGFTFALAGDMHVSNYDDPTQVFELTFGGSPVLGAILYTSPDGTQLVVNFPTNTSNKEINFPTDVNGTLALQEWVTDQKGVANGLATLDSGGTVPLDQLPYSVAEFKGVWNADTNIPTLSDASGNNGDFYTVSVGGTQDLGSGNITFVAGNTVIYNGALAIWQQTGPLATGTVTSVGGDSSLYVTVANGTGAAVITIVAAPKLRRLDASPILINNVAFDGSANILLNQSINAQTGTTYTFVLTDNQKLVTASNASAQTYTVPPNSSVAFPVGTRIDIIQKGAGKVTLAQGAGVTINSYGSNKAIAGQYVGVSLFKESTDVWYLVGNLIA